MIAYRVSRPMVYHVARARGGMNPLYAARRLRGASIRMARVYSFIWLWLRVYCC